jgi:predicted permease
MGMRMRPTLSKFAAFWLRRSLDARLDAETRTHLEMLTAEYERRGLSPDEARHAARRAFGGLEQMKETYRDQRGWRIVDELWRDLRYAVRLLVRSPVFAIVAVLSLAVGIGGNAAMFALLDAAVLRELPVEDPDRLAAIQPYRSERLNNISYPVFRELAGRQRVFDEVAASGSVEFRRARLQGAADDLPELDGAMVSANYFSMLGVRAVRGRLFTADDSRGPGEGAVAVVSYRFWERTLNRDPTIVGRTILLENIPFTIVGVAAQGFFGDRVGTAREIWIPMLMQPRLQRRNLLEARTASWFRTIGRLAPGVDERRAGLELSAIFRQAKADEIAAGTGSLRDAGDPKEFRVDVVRGTAGLNAQRSRYAQPLRLLMAAVGIVLLIVCCNLANLLLARASTRQREIGVRLAVGASRGRLVRQLLTESLLLSVIGGAAGWLLAWWATASFAAELPIGTFEVQPDSRVFAFTGVMTTLTGLLFGLVPALHATARDTTPTLRPAPAGWTTQPRFRTRQILVVVQVALSLWVLAGAALLVRSLQNLSSFDVGVDRRNVATVTVTADPALTAEQMPLLRQELENRLAAIPGIASVAFTSYGLFRDSAQTAPARVPASAVDPASDREFRQNFVSTAYFLTMGMPMLRGRSFTTADRPGSPAVVIINETAATHYFGSDDPIGRLIHFPRIDPQGRYVPFAPQLDPGDGAVIVGVVRDAKYGTLRETPVKMAYLPIEQHAEGLGLIHLRLEANSDAVGQGVREVVRRVSPALTVRQFSMLEDDIATTLAQEHLVTRLLSAFALVSVVLACLGLYGVLAYAVVSRTKEIGVRVALGATRSEVITMIVGHAARLTVLGVFAGLGAALSTSHLLERLLFGLSRTDSTTMAGVAVLMLAVALLAAGIPAARALAINPAVALRNE